MSVNSLFAVLVKSFSVLLITGSQLFADHTPDIQFTIEEKAFLDSLEAIRICTDPDWLPYEGIDHDQYVGIMAEFHQMWASWLNKPLVLVKTENWQQSLDYIRTKRCDVLSSAQYLPERESYLAVTNSVIQYPLALATKYDIDSIHNVNKLDTEQYKIGMVAGHAGIDMVIKRYPNIQMVLVSSAKEALTQMERGELFGFIDTVPSTYYQMLKAGVSDIKVNTILDVHYDTAVGIRNDWPLLLSIYNKDISYTSELDKQEILSHWLSIKYDYQINWHVVFEIAIAILVLLTFAAYRYRLVSQHNQQLRELNEKLSRMSYSDQLTGIANRYYLEEALRKEFKQFNDTGIYFALILIDIDHFKSINDQYGHLVGDKVIQQFSELLATHLPKRMHLGRWGGEEFLIVCPKTSIENTLRLAEKLRTTIENSQFSEVDRIVTASFGITCFKSNDTSIEKTLIRADQALYRAKNAGRNRVSCL